MARLPDFDVNWERPLETRRILKLDPNSPIAIKRDVRQCWVSVRKEAFVQAFASAMAAPERRFCSIQIIRDRGRDGHPFELGERFQGRFELGAFLGHALPAGRWLGGVSGKSSAWIRKLEDRLTSDYGEIVELDTTSQIARIQYVYLEGSAMAGSSTFTVEATDSGCKVTQIWEYQELRKDLLKPFSTYVLRLHLGVVHSQIQQAAEAAGGQVTQSQIPKEYQLR